VRSQLAAKHWLSDSLAVVLRERVLRGSINADDVILIGHSPGAARQRLDVLDVFCTLFGMEVSLAPTTTCVVVFRAKTLAAPRGLRLIYRGHVVSVQQQYIYLGTKLH